MKKFFSIFCALTVLLSVNAAPQIRLAKDGSIQKQPRVMLKSAAKKQDARFADLRMANQKPAALAKAPRAKKTETDITIGQMGSKDYGSGNIYYALISDDEVYRFNFDFYLDASATDVELGVTYTIEALGDDLTYSFGKNNTTSETYQYAEIAFTKNVVNEKVQISATVTDTEGNVWNLFYDEANAPEAPKGGTFIADQAVGSYYSSTSDIQYIMTFTEAKLKFSFDILLPSGESDVVSGQEYTLDDMDAEYTWASFNSTTSIEIASASFTKTVAEDGSFTIVAVVVDGEGNTWNLSYAQGAPNVVDFNLTLNGTVEEGSYYSQIEAADADTTVYVSLIFFGALEDGATITDDDLFYPTVILTDGDEQAYYDLQDVDLAVAYNEEANIYTITGTMLGINEDDATDQIAFTVTLTIAGPEPIVPDREEDFVMTGARLVTFDDGFQLVGDEETRYITIAAYSDVVAGDYTASDLEADYTYIGFFNNTDTVWYDLAEADITIEVNGETATITGDFLGTEYVLDDSEAENVLFHLNITATIEEYNPTGIENVELSEKARKVAVDGQLFIIRDGKMFNAQGAQVR